MWPILALAVTVLPLAPTGEEDLLHDVVAPRTSPPGPVRADIPHVLYLNFSDGTERMVKSDADSAPDNATVLGSVDPYPAFSWPTVEDGTVSRAAIVRSLLVDLQRAFLPYDIVLTTTRPSAPPYTMVMVGGTPDVLGFESKVAGVALMDCDNRQESNVVFAFPPVVKGKLRSLFVTIAQEAAHSYGLEHTSSPEDLMFPKVDPRQLSFPDVDTEIVGDRTCGRALQNSHRRLLELVGAWPGGDKPLFDGSFVDTEAPALRFVSPGPGARVPATFAVRVAADDTVGLERVELEAGGERATLGAPPFEWRLEGFAAGPLVLKATAYDSSGNKTEASVPIEVRPPDADGGCTLGRGRAASARHGAAAWVLGMFFVVLRLAQRRRGDYKHPLSEKDSTMPKLGIHPLYKKATISCACGNRVETYSTRGDFMVDICGNCHPFYTGKQKFIDTGGRIERFQKRYQQKKPATPTPSS